VVPNFVLETTGAPVDIEDLSIDGDFTVEFSVYLTPGDPVSSADTVFSGPGMTFDFDGGVPRFVSGTNTVVAGATAAPVGAWTNVTLVRSGVVVSLIVDGEFVAQDNWTPDLQIGEIAAGLSGRIDGLRIWDVARSGTEIDAGQAGFVDIADGVPPGLVRYYRFDDDPDHIVDATGNAETGHSLHLPAGAQIVEDNSAPAAVNAGTGSFIDTTVVSNLLLATDMVFLPDGRMIITQKDGNVTLVSDPTQINSATSNYLDHSGKTLSQVEAGMLGVVVDPNFENNGYVYIYYVNSDESKATLSRFVHVEDGGGTLSYLDPASETVLWQETDVFSDGHHQGGGIDIAYEPIGPDDPSPYKIYIGVGEEFEGANAQDLTHDDGKVHRINLTDGSIPTDNPYYDPVAAAAYTPWIDTSSSISTSAENLARDSEGVMTTIWAYGMRNPFRGSYDQESGTFWVGDVGGNTAFSWEDIHVIRKGADHGWPGEEGYHADANDPGSPVLSYQHLTGPGVNQVGQFGASGASVSGGLVYRGEEFPEQFHGGYFYGDWVRKWIRYAEVDWSSGEPVVVNDSHFANTTGQVLTFEEGPDGALYYITTFQTGGVASFTGTVNRLIYDTNNRAPTGQGILLDPGEEASTTTPHTVTFEADVSDPDGDALTYQWSFGDGVDLDGDGRGDTATSTEAAPTWTFTDPGTYLVELIITDANEAAKVFQPVEIRVGNAPVVTIDSPADGITFRAGETLTLSGSVTDIEDGVLDPADTFWSAQFFHNDHVHPQLSATPNQAGGLTLDVPIDGHDYFGDTGFFIYLTATDSDGLTSSERVFVRPEESVVTYDIPDVAGFVLTIDGIAYDADIAYDNVIGFHHTLTVPETYAELGVAYAFSHWSDDPTNTDATRTFIVPEADTTLSPIYEQTGVVSQSLEVSSGAAEAMAPLTLGQGGSDFTIEGWVRFADADFVTKVDGLVSGTDGGGSPFDLNFHRGEAHLYASGVGRDIIGGSTKMFPGEWHHIAISRAAGIVTLYVDGVEDDVATLPWTEEITIDTLGGSIGGGSASLEGALDEVRFWSVARSAAEIAATFDKPVANGSAGLVRRYDLDGTGQDAVGAADLDVTGDTFIGGAPLIFGPVNAPPTAVDDVIDLPEGFDPVASHLHILMNDSDPDGQIDRRTVEIVDQATHGTVEMIDTPQELADRGLHEGHYGHAEYQPADPAFVGTDSFTYRIQDDQGAWSNVATVNLTIGNPPPVAADDAIVLAQGFDPLTSHLHILMNDNDPNGSIDRRTVEIVSGTAHGTLEVLDIQAELDARGKGPQHFGHVEYYVTDPTFAGFDSFTYRVQDDGGAWSNVATVSIEVVGDPRPVAGDDSVSLPVGFDPLASRIDVLANDSDNGALVVDSVEILTGPAQGSVEVIDTAQELSDLGLTAESLGDVIYTPTDPAFAGTDAFTYRVQDDQGGWSDPASVSITITETSTSGQALALLAAAPLDIPALTLGQEGGDFTVEGWMYLADGAWVTKVDGLFKGFDESGSPFDLNFHRGNPHLYATGLGMDVVKGGSELEAGTWHHLAVSREAGIVSLYVDGALDGVSGTAWNSAVTFTQLGGSVGGGSNGLNGSLDEVRFWSSARTSQEIADGMTAATNPSAAGLVRAYGFDGDLSEATGSSMAPAMPAGASFVGGVAPGDGGDGPPVNLAPAGAGILLDPGEDAGGTPHLVTFEADMFDPEGTALSYVWDFGDGTTGTAAAPSHQYVTAGSYSVTVTATDGDGLSTTFAPVTITVTDVPPPNAAPTAAADAATTDQNMPAVIEVLANDGDSDGTLVAASVEIVSGPAQGSVEVLDQPAELTARGLDPTSMGAIEYVPGTDYVGIDTFTYRVQDDDGDWSDPASVTLTVEADGGGPIDTPTGGPNGGSAEFGGRGSGLDIADVTISGDFTFESWLIFDPTGGITNKDALFGAGVYDDDRSDADATDGVFGNSLNFHKAKVNFYASEGTPDNQRYDDFVFSNDVWTHVALTRAGNVYTTYIDGTALAPKVHGFQGDVVIDRLAASFSSNRDLDGRLDDVRIWNDARTATEIVDGLDGVDVATETDLLRYYDFEDQSHVVDISGNGEAAGELAWAATDASWIDVGTPFV
jgi:PKD repeat protein